MVVELNYRPGLSIQIANQAGLRKRLERIEDLNVLSAKHGIRIAKALFAENYFETTEERLTIVNPKEKVLVFGDKGRRKEIQAWIKTGRFRSAISSDIAQELGLIDVEDLLWYQQEEGEGKVPVVEVKFELKEELISTSMIVSKRLNRSRHKMEIGRKDMDGLLVKVEKTF